MDLPLVPTAATALAALVAARMLLRRLMRSSAVERDQVVWITGASSGIGRALALRCAKLGARLILSARSRPALEEVARECGGDGRAAVFVLDLSTPEGLAEKAREALDIFGRIDVLVNNAGVSTRAAAAETELSVEKDVMNINFFSPVELTKAVLPHMLARGSGQIVVTSSVQGLLAVPYRTTYGSSKHALHGYFDALRGEVSHRNIHILLVSPGYVRTNLSLTARTADGSHHGVMDKDILEGYDPDYIARRILDGMSDRTATLVIAPLKVRSAIVLRTLWPALLNYILQRRAAHERDEIERTARE